MNGLIYKQFYSLSKDERAKQKHQKGICIWFTGLSGSGKSTLANQLEQQLFKRGKHNYVLDGDNLRQGLCSDLDFSVKSRSENIRRVSEVAKMMVDAGLITIVTLISPYQKDRDAARLKFDDKEFIEVYLSTSIEECEKRDVKGLYKKARSGLVSNFTGISSDYEIPDGSELDIDTDKLSVKECTEILIDFVSNY